MCVCDDVPYSGERCFVSLINGHAAFHVCDVNCIALVVTALLINVTLRHC